ncbi:MAG: hypothetical protein IIX02_05440 [Clostridia bacterium]|nr:hypothetical protein [Clostridia bacterium]
MKNSITIEYVKKDSLKLLGATLSDDILAASIPQLIEKDDTYAQYLKNMDESINRALQRIVTEGKLPNRTFVLSFADSYPNGVIETAKNVIVSLETCVSEFRELVKVDFVRDGGLILQDVDYGTLGDEIILPRLHEGEKYAFTYKYAPPTVSPFMKLSAEALNWRDAELAAGATGEGAYNKNVLDIPNELASIVPKFVFGELYMHDEPNVAMYQGINQFEAYLSQYNVPTNKKLNKIKNILEGFN